MRALRFRPGIKKIPKKGRTVNFGKKFNKNEVFLGIGIYIWRISAKKMQKNGIFYCNVCLEIKNTNRKNISKNRKGH